MARFVSASIRLVLFALIPAFAGAAGSQEAATPKADRAIATPTEPPPGLRLSAFLEAPHAKDTSIVWCSTFQIAWDTLGDEFCGEPLRLEGTPQMETELNKRQAGRGDVDAASYYAKAVRLKKGVLDEINAELKEKFGDNAPPPVTCAWDGQTPAVLSYAFLFKNLVFAVPFDKQDEAMVWQGEDGKGTALEAFGVQNMGAERQRALAAQVLLIDLKSRDDFVVELKTKSDKDRLIVAEVPPGKTLKETLDAVRARVAKKRASAAPLGIGDVFRMPKIALNLEHSFDEIVGKIVLNEKLSGYQVAEATQSIRLNIDEQGALLASEAKIWIAGNGHAPLQLILDKPFLVYQELDGAKAPYLVLWVGNPVPLVRSAKAPAANAATPAK